MAHVCGAGSTPVAGTPSPISPGRWPRLPQPSTSRHAITGHRISSPSNGAKPASDDDAGLADRERACGGRGAPAPIVLGDHSVGFTSVMLGATFMTPPPALPEMLNVLITPSPLRSPLAVPVQASLPLPTPLAW